MKTPVIIRLFLIFSISLIITSCPDKDPIVLHGDLTGIITDCLTGEPIQGAIVELLPDKINSVTGNDGSYLLKNIIPGIYDIQASKPTYGIVTQNTTVKSVHITEINFDLCGIPTLEFSDTILDYGVDLTSKSFTISNIGAGKLIYSILPNQDWITVDPVGGEVTTEAHTITVSIDRTGLSENKQIEKITITSSGGEEPQVDQIDVYVNGVLGPTGYYYHIVRIGTQTWMAENLNDGVRLHLFYGDYPRENEAVEKFCYDDDKMFCDTFGGLYSWSEMMNYYPPDSGMIGTTQGICPEGWHIPTTKEWETLRDYLGGEDVAGGALKDTGNIQEGTGHWEFPNEGATNESGFTALPGGFCSWATEDPRFPPDFQNKGITGEFWSASRGIFSMHFAGEKMGFAILYIGEKDCGSVRCIKDPP